MYFPPRRTLCSADEASEVTLAAPPQEERRGVGDTCRPGRSAPTALKPKHGRATPFNSRRQKMFPIRSLEIISSCRKSVFGSALSLAFVMLALFAATADAQAQTATIFGALSNFDVVNDTGHDAHGFEIQLEGLQAADIYYTFSA